MALDFTLNIATQRALPELAEALGTAAGLTGTGREREGRGFTATVLEMHRETVAMVRDALEFAPTLSVFLAVKDEEASDNIDAMILAIARLFAAERGNAVLVSASGRTLLVRIAGRVARNSDDGGFWTPARIAALGTAAVEELPWM